MRIIGIELRIRNPQTGSTKELALIPLDLEVPDGAMFSMPCTLHTERGDINLDFVNGQQQMAQSVRVF